MELDTASSPSALETNGAAQEILSQCSAAAEQLLHRLETRNATIGVVGLGYVGLPLAVEYADRGFSTVGIDLDEQRVDQLNSGENYLEDLDSARVRRLVDEEELRGAATFEDSGDIDVFFICVPTPVTETNEPDTSYIEAATESIARHLRPGQLVVLIDRVEDILEDDDVTVRDILVVSYTRAAAAEVRERLAERLDTNPRRLRGNVCTMHAKAYELLDLSRSDVVDDDTKEAFCEDYGLEFEDEYAAAGRRTARSTAPRSGPKASPSPISTIHSASRTTGRGSGAATWGLNATPSA